MGKILSLTDYQTPTLYEVYSITTAYPNHEGRTIVLHWFRYDTPDRPAVPFHKAIANYRAGMDYTEGYILELFTLQQAQALQAHLSNLRDTQTFIQPVHLPLTVPDGQEVMPWGAIAVGGGDDFYMLSNVDDWPLPFEVWGYYRLGESAADPDPAGYIEVWRNPDPDPMGDMPEWD